MPDFPLPSEIMRHNRPYLFSDSTTEEAYVLGRSELSHHLDSLTQRNQHQDFEIFARKLCEREICPNLRPQTGPEGGGDGKVDTETYAVASEISDRWHQGLANSSKERWGFAFSAKEKWSEKVRSDVKGMVETGREYDRVIFVTSRSARSKDRLRIEDELTEKHGIPVTVHDRSWILDKVFEHDHQDLAFKYLNAGQFDESKLATGPRDFERKKELDALEEQLAKNGQSGGEITQSVADALDAAQLSRMLERPRIETFGRFERAIRLATKHGTRRQKMFALYERAWTALWWLDDIEPMNEDYDEIEELAFVEDHADDVSKLSNLYTVLAARVAQGWETAEALDTLKRGERLQAKIEEISKDTSRPNNALYGKTLGHLYQLSLLSGSKKAEQLDPVWKGLSEVIDQAHGLGEFPAELIELVTEALQPFAPTSDVFDALVLKLAEFMGERAKEGKAGAILLRRGEQRLEAEEPIEAIRWLGKASIYFMKEEYEEEQFKTLYYLTVAYRGAGLLWAARSVALAAMVRALALSDEKEGPRPELVPAGNLVAMISIQLGRVTDALNVILWLRNLHEVLPLSEDGRASLRDKLREFDHLLMCLFVNLDANDLQELSIAPDVLEKLQLFSSRMTLLLLLGHAEHLKQDGSMPEDASIEELVKFTELAAIQPAARDLPKRLFMYQACKFECATTVLGVRIEFGGGNTVEDHLLCEAHLSALEAFLATAVEVGMFAHAERLQVNVEIDKEVQEPSLVFEPETMTMVVKWPSKLDITAVKHHSEFSNHLIEFCANVVDAIAIVSPEKEGGFMAQLVDELVVQRSVGFSNACMGNHRLFGTYASTLEKLAHLSEKSYPLNENAPTITKGDYLDDRGNDEEGFTEPDKIAQSHKDYAVESIINLHLWDKAGWNGVMFAGYGPQYPPVLALVFRDEDKARSIFSGWQAKFGQRDEDGDIRLALIKGIDAQHPFHYRASISKNFDVDRDDLDSRKKYMQATRMLTMEPSENRNLETFLKDYESKQCYFLAPAVLVPGKDPHLLADLSILKRDLYVREAWEIGLNDMDSMAIRLEDNVRIPDEKENPPIQELMEVRKRRAS